MTWLIIPSLALASLLTSWDPNMPLAAIIALMAIAGCVQLARGKWQMDAFPAPLSWLLLSFTLWAGLSALWSSAPFDTWRSLSVWLLLPVWAWLIAGLNPSYIKKLFVAAASIILLLSLIAFLQMGSGAAFASDQFRAPSLFANPNTFAALIITLLLPLQHVWFARTSELGKSRAMQIGISIVLVALFAALVLTISRIALGAFIGLTILQLFMERDGVKTDWKRIAIYGAALFAVYFLLNYTGGNKILQRIEYIAHPISTSERLLVWDSTWHAYLLQPFVGHGFGALYVPFAALRHRDDGTYGQFAHSDALQYLAELGPVGFLLAVGIILSFVWMSVVRLRDGFLNRNDRVWFIAVSTGLLACFGSALVTYIFYLPALLLACALLLGLWASLYWVDDDAPEREKRPVSGLVFFIGAALLCGLHVSAIMTDKADQSIRRFSIEDHLRWNQWASRLSFDLNPRVALEWIDVLLSQATLEKKPEQFAALDGMFERLQRLQPGIPQLWTQRARLNAARGRVIEAESDLQKALLLDPAYLPARMMLGKLYREQGRDEATIEDLYDEGLRWRLTEVKYNIVTLDDMKAGESNMPRLSPSNHAALLPPVTKSR